MSETITGVCDAITEKGDWTTFEINVGSQYPVRLSTKVPELIELGRAARASGEPMDWTFNAVEGNINPKSGKPYINRYFEGVGPAGSQNGPDANVSPSAAPKDAMTKEDWAAKDSAIHKMACIKTAAAALTHTLPSDPTEADLKKFLEREAFLSTAWHNTVVAVRDGVEPPF